MQSQDFDRLATSVASRFSRRAALCTSAGIAGLALAAPTGLAATQDATPAASPVPAGEKTTFLFVQSFAGGSIMPKPGQAGTYVLSLEGDHGRTIGFSDRPERIVATGPTQAFLDGFIFSPVDPPNAALVFAPSVGETDIIVLELLNPQYDDATSTVTYDVHVLDTFDDSELSFQEEPRPPDPAGETFGPAELFIDDCPNLNACYNPLGQVMGPIPGYPNGIGTCWGSWGPCQPDHPNCNGPSQDALNQLCNQYGDCGNACFASV